jgi:hypothetical protein
MGQVYLKAGQARHAKMQGSEGEEGGLISEQKRLPMGSFPS